jgi:hypothetical protein
MIGLTLAAGLSLWLPLPYIVRLTAAALLAVLLPGWLCLQLVDVSGDTMLEQLVLAAGAGYGLIVLGSLGLLYAAGYVSAPWLVGLLTVLSLSLAAGCLWRAAARTEQANPPRWPTRPELALFALPVAVAAFFSFTNLGYSDYWGDEMNGLLRAVSIIEGRPETLFEHTKGPVEVLLPAVFGLLAGRFETFTVRLPFALAHVVGVGGFYCLGRHMFNRRVGLLAALILALNGLYLAFGRMLQYQAVVFLMTALSLLLAYHFYRHGRGIYLAFSALFAGVGLLAHYDTLLALPPIVYLVWQRYRQSDATWQKSWPWPAGAALVLIGVTALFYVPFLLHPHLSETSSYLARVIGAADWPGNNFDELYLFAVMYNSRYYVLFITLLGLGVLAAGVIRLFRQRWLERWFWPVVGTALGLSLLAAVTGRLSFIPMLAFSLLFVTLIAFTSGSIELKTVYLWIGVSFVGYVFFIDHPRTHLQIIYPGWSLLVALTLDRLATKIREGFAGEQRRRLTAGATAILILLFGFFAAYEYLLFADADREYIFTYPKHKHSVYWEDARFPFGSRRLYGAPHRLGWQMIQYLFARGELQGDWDSNDEGSNLFWYTLGAQRNPCYPRYYFLTQFEQREDDDTQSPSFNETDYVQIGQIWNGDRLQIDVFEFAPLSHDRETIIQAEPARYETVVGPGDFYSLPFEDAQPHIAQPLSEPVLFQPSSGALDQIAAHYSDPRIVQVRDTVALLGHDLDDTWAVPGGLVVVSLYWQAVETVNLPYKIFTHLISVEADSAQLWAQADDFPACGAQSTQHWQVGEIVMDRHVLRLPAGIPPGVYKLDVGLYEPQTGLRLDKLDVMHNPQGNSVDIGQVTVRPAG